WSGEGTAARSGNPADGAGSFGAASAQRGSAGAVAAGSFRGALLLSPQIELYSPGGDRYTPPEPGAPDWVPGRRTARRGITPGDRQLELTGEMELGVSKVLIIGAGGVGRVVAHKCSRLNDVISDIVLASRTKSRCDEIAAEVKEMTGRTIVTDQVDADDVEATTALLRKHRPQLVINVALPYQDLSIMDACLAAGVHYL